VYLPTKFQVLHPNQLCYKTREGLWNFFKISSSQNHPYSLPFFQKCHNHSIYFPSFHHLLKLIILFLPQKVVGTSFFKIQIESYVQKKKAANYSNSPFEEKEKEGGEGRPRFGGLWKVPMPRFNWNSFDPCFQRICG
jgi:hypothetical protein